MRLGVLLCDDVAPELQVAHGNYRDMFSALFHDYSKQITLVFYRVIDGEYPKDVEECDAYITSGSQFGANDGFVWIGHLMAFIERLYEENKPLVGICFGHQLMAKALGGEVVTSGRGWGIGVNSYAVKKKAGWMKGAGSNVSLVVSHQDQISQLPSEARVLAGSDFCPFAMIQIKTCFLGIQGHPEFTKAYVKDLMTARRQLYAAEAYEKGIDSLSQPVDDKRVVSWIVSFLDTALAKRRS
ncbi:glutamine amidotransferase-related protein [Photobacterium halotolerans]|uniref:GMP synthase n=1 Tax=Photobacterium halotolerans TaxID=265726 RepID=A0A7X4XVC6_9GAMM|nr:gamma-glutamyl-gamma-aminobutyrate hydrolase family protein [Photobacterium halotolerans]NAW65901.1 GMP synthase [Photobacterium halotolerans]NAW86248.1 GMP synthase [Photobacterium halotolerans]NAX45973.1 GMP synthase [Photobacterium halotolerans]